MFSWSDHMKYLFSSCNVVHFESPPVFFFLTQTSPCLYIAILSLSVSLPVWLSLSLVDWAAASMTRVSVVAMTMPWRQLWNSFGMGLTWTFQPEEPHAWYSCFRGREDAMTPAQTHITHTHCLNTYCTSVAKYQTIQNSFWLSEHMLTLFKINYGNVFFLIS